MKRHVSKTKRCDMTGKVSYRDAESAKRALNYTSKLPGKYVPVRWYHCDGDGGCGQWHLTSQEER